MTHTNRTPSLFSRINATLREIEATSTHRDEVEIVAEEEEASEEGVAQATAVLNSRAMRARKRA